jgi:3'(2'), 5'-bisphosphate nucleotidase
MDACKMSNNNLLSLAVAAAFKAGDAILDVYRTNFSVEEKEDRSPLTLADRRGHEIIEAHLVPSKIPVLSEEGRRIPYTERKNWERLWVVDPLDGTKEFVKRNGEFTVNIALVESGRPVLGVVLVPDRGILYYGGDGLGAFMTTGDDFKVILEKNRAEALAEPGHLIQASTPLPSRENTGRYYTIVGSRSHAGPDLEAFVSKARQAHGRVDFISAGSSLKFCLVAEGRADIYPRLGPTMEWDTAAGQAVVEAAGGRVLVSDTGAPLTYNRENLLNPWFVVHAP